MKYSKFVLIIFFTVVSLKSIAQSYSQPVDIISSGAENSTIGSYSNFGVIGDSFVNQSMSNVIYDNSAGFLNSFKITVGLNKQLTHFESKVFPNPSHNVVYIEFSQIPTGYHLQFYNNLGQLINQKECLSLTEKIDLKDIPNGIYYLKIFNKEFSKTEKIIVKSDLSK